MPLLDASLEQTPQVLSHVKAPYIFFKKKYYFCNKGLYTSLYFGHPTPAA